MSPTEQADERLLALRELARRNARRDLLAFALWCWRGSSPMAVGRHTKAICARLTKAVDDYLLEGKSTYLLINTPPRHGKSELLSRTFPAFFLARCAEKQPSVIMSGYGASLVEGFSKQCKALIRSDAFRELFPGVEIDHGRDAVDSWGIKGSRGEVAVVGLGGAITGKGANAILLDDAVKNREEAYSTTIQEKSWFAFSSDLMSRQNAGGCIVVVLMTRWHLQDIGGKILDAMAHDDSFPRFEVMTFPAKNPPEYDYLFPELYPPEWYEEQYATLGPTMAAALLDCDPVGEGNRMFSPDWFQTYGTMPPRETMRVYIMVDSANSKLVGKTNDPDFTVMTVWGWGRDGNYYLLDAVRDRIDLAGRSDTIFALVERWHPNAVFWESVGAMADTQHIRLEQDRRGYRFSIVELKQRVPKIDRIGWLVPLFEQRRIWFPVRILRARDDGRAYDFVNDFLNDEYLPYPASRHDDMLDCIANLRHPTVISNASFPQTRTATARRREDTWVPF